MKKKNKFTEIDWELIVKSFVAMLTLLSFYVCYSIATGNEVSVAAASFASIGSAFNTFFLGYIWFKSQEDDTKK